MIVGSGDFVARVEAGGLLSAEPVETSDVQDVMRHEQPQSL